MTDAKIQTRGHCQCCGSIQAVRNGFLSQHGYTVQNGWFNGVCQGHQHASIETDRTVADLVVKQVRSDVANHLQNAENLKSGKTFPKFIRGNWDISINDYRKIPFAEAPEYSKVSAVKSAVYAEESRYRTGEAFADEFEALINRVHGQPLLKVPKPEAAARIQAGEQRLNERGLVLTALYQDAARVYYSYINSTGKLYKGAWIGSRAWRALKTPEKQVENV